MQPVFRAEKSRRNMFGRAGIDAASLAQSKRAGGGDGHCSLSLSCDSSAVLSCHSGLSMRGCMSIICGFAMCRGGSCSITVGLGPGCGGSLCVVEAWGGPCFVRRDSHAFRGLRCKAGDWGGIWGVSGGCSSDFGTLGIGPVCCDMEMGSVDPTGGSVHDTVGCGAGGVISIVVEHCSVVVGTVPIVHDVALGEQGSSLVLDGCGLIWDMCCVICDVADV